MRTIFVVPLFLLGFLVQIFGDTTETCALDDG
jgi:hypothetical protein